MLFHLAKGHESGNINHEKAAKTQGVSNERLLEQMEDVDNSFIKFPHIRVL